ncbi:MAG: hypothetical protein JWM80_563 [Cyanobacteria bacterium RYN_339]|nr:hypothetical protein [Cyanobacteria bacterium RYN_339]
MLSVAIPCLLAIATVASDPAPPIRYPPPGSTLMFAVFSTGIPIAIELITIRSGANFAVGRLLASSTAGIGQAISGDRDRAVWVSEVAVGVAALSMIGYVMVDQAAPQLTFCPPEFICQSARNDWRWQLPLMVLALAPEVAYGWAGWDAQRTAEEQWRVYRSLTALPRQAPASPAAATAADPRGTGTPTQARSGAPSGTRSACPSGPSPTSNPRPL